MEKQLLVATCSIAFLMIGWNIKALSSLCYKEIKGIGSLLLGFTALRYLTLVLYAFSQNRQLIYNVRYFYYASSIGITMLTALTVWYILPFLKERIKLSYYLLAFLPWDIFYIYLILKQPTMLVESSAYGYELILMNPFNRYLSVAQGSFIAIIIILCIIGMITYKHLQIRAQLFIIILAQALLVVDGIYSGGAQIKIFKLFTVTEVFALWSIYYGLSNSIKSIKAIQNQ